MNNDRTPRKDELVSLYNAFVAMYAYLTIHLERFSESEELKVILGELEVLNDGGPFDPAAWFDWLKCVDKARAGLVDNEFRLYDE